MDTTAATDRSAAGRKAPRLRALSFYLAVAANAAALVAFACSPQAEEYPLAALAIAAFLLVQILLPACRPVWEAPLCPANIAQAFFWVQLVLVALLIGFWGVHEGTLPRLPSVEAIHTGIVLRVLGYVAFCVAYQFGGLAAPPRGSQRATPRAAVLVAVTFLVLGAIGQCLAYQSLGEFVELVSSPARERERAAEETTPAKAAATFLRPFLSFGLVMIWSGWLGREKRTRTVRVSVYATALLLPLLLVANFSYNRGSLVAPLVALAAAYSIHVRRISYPAVALAGAFVLAVVMAFGWYRSTNLEVTDVAEADLGESWSEDHVAEFFQIYASGPQMAAYLIEERRDEPLYYGRTLFCSVLYPVPLFGKAYREESGVGILNRLIYQDSDNVDQVIPYDAELYINFHVMGVMAGYALLGWLVRYFQGRFLTAPRAVESYAWMLLGLWVVFPGSLPVLSQMCIYFFWPIYLYFAVKACLTLELPGQLRRHPGGGQKPPLVAEVGTS
jgi:hypothetical protein